MGRYGASELMRNKKLQKKAVNYGINKLSPFIQDSVGSAMDQLSTKVRPKKRYKTNRRDLDGAGIDPVTVVKKAPDIATVLCKRNANEICRNQRNYANFGTQISNFRFRRKCGEISVLLLF